MKPLLQRGIYSEDLILPGKGPRASATGGPPSSVLLNPEVGAGPKFDRSILATLSAMCKDHLANLTEDPEPLMRAEGEESALEPKVMESHEPIPGRVPRKVEIQRKRIKYASFDLRKGLAESQTVRSWIADNKHWIRLELVDDEAFEDYTPSEWLEKAGEKGQASAKMVEIKASGYTIQNCTVNSYDPARKEYTVTIEDGSVKPAKRIEICFNAEDPRKYLSRIESAILCAQNAAVKLKYHYFIDKMLTDDVGHMNEDQKNTVLSLAKPKSMDKIPNEKELKEEIHSHYATAMNSLVFDTYAADYTKEFGIQDIADYIAKKKEEENRKESDPKKSLKKGFIDTVFVSNSPITENLIPLPRQKFSDVYKELCFSSLFIKQETLQALEKIKYHCQNALKQEFFVLNHSSSKRLDEFKTIQESAVSQAMIYLKQTWVQGMIDVIRSKFGEIGKGWFNMKETNRLTYEFGKLKRFLTVVRMIMQDTLRQLLSKNLKALVAFFEESIPKEVDVRSETTVNNFYEGEVCPSILSLDLMQVTNKEEFNYLIRSDKINSDLIGLFEKVIEELKRIPDLEPKVLESLHKAKKTETFVLTPILLKEQPEIPDPNIVPKRYPDENMWLWELHRHFKSLLAQATEPLEAYRLMFKKFDKILSIKPEDVLGQIDRENENEENKNTKNLEMLRKELKKWQDEEAILRAGIPEEIQVSCFSVNCKEALRVLMGKYRDVSQKIIENLSRFLRERSSAIEKKFSDIEKDLLKPSQNIEELTRLNEFVTNDFPGLIEKLKVETTEISELHEMLEGQKTRLGNEEISRRWKLVGMPKELIKLIDEKQKVWEKTKVQLTEEMMTDQESFRRDISEFEKNISTFYNFTSIDEHHEIMERVSQISTRIDQIQEAARVFNQREALMQREITDYSAVTQMSRSFQVYHSLWKNVNYWMDNRVKWFSETFEKVDANAADRFTEEGPKALAACVRAFREKAKETEGGEKFKDVLVIAEKIKKEVEEFKVQVPLLVALRQEGLRDRHRQEITRKTGLKLAEAELPNFQAYLDNGFQSHMSVCVEVGEKAGRELAIEKSLGEMENIWARVDFEMKKHKETGTFVISNFEAVETVLDQHLSDTQNLMVNPFKGPFGERIDKWNESLIGVSNLIEEWTKFQAQWTYLQPIFDSPDINKQLPNESSMFRKVDSNWRSTANQTRLLKNVLSICTNEGYLDKFRDANASLERIQKELKSYLELKRSRFGRFYFLSNDDLLSILSQTKDVEKIQDHLRKVFENIARLTFEPDKRISAMHSIEEETVHFGKRAVDPTLKQVEDWMTDVQTSMMLSVKDALYLSAASYSLTPRTSWILQHPGQCVLNGSQINWSFETETAILRGKLPEYCEFLDTQLKELVRLDRASFTRNQLITIEALIVIDVHAKDVVESLARAEVDTLSAFEWVSQLRYYWSNFAPKVSEKAAAVLPILPQKSKAHAPTVQLTSPADTALPIYKDSNCLVRCLQTEFVYGYEYLGNSSRLVITPLTDKCYMTLMSALRLNLGGAPAGPAGTGKTESTKDLARALAKQCVVFNCQESMDYQFVGKFFKGLASSGAWCCFDEFNRINLEVLSVVAQQLQQLFGAKAAGLTTLAFEGSEIKLQGDFSVFITMNPGYAGRTELPDNLKALFRPVAMMVPDYALIAEIKLYSFGFEKARELAKKMVATFKLASEQLSAQSHYDYGMRAVTSVLNAVGILKRSTSSNECSEEQLLLRSLRDVNLPKFLAEDLPLFQFIIKDLFPATVPWLPERAALSDATRRACAAQGLVASPVFMEKVFQVYDTGRVRHGLMVIGQTGGGKTSCWRVLQNAINLLAAEGVPGFDRTNLDVINPKSISMAQLYGEYKDLNWNEGIVEIVFERAINLQFDPAHSSEQSWILFDGPVDALWIESMNTVLDDSKKVCLSSGKVLLMSSRMTVMFEVDDLSQASPATVSRCGMVFLEQAALGVPTLLEAVVSSLAKSLRWPQAIATGFRETAGLILTKILGLVRGGCSEPAKTIDNCLIAGFGRICDSITRESVDLFTFDESRKRAPEAEATAKAKNEAAEKRLPNLALFAAIWSAGGSVDREGHEVISRELAKWLPSQPISPAPTLYADFFGSNWEPRENRWVPWFDSGTAETEDGRSAFHELILPTADSVRISYVASLLLKHGHHVLIPGSTGCGKTTNAYSMLSKMPESFISASMAFSAQTSEHQVLELVLSQIGKRKKGIFGPASGKKLVAFVDDVNLPKREQFGAQRPIELLRQFLDHDAWYVWRLNKELIHIEDLVLLAAMAPGGGGRQELAPRFQRHFHVLAYPDLDRDTLSFVFEAVLRVAWKKMGEVARNEIKSLVSATIEFYTSLKKVLLPIPGRTHYQFSSRDLGRVFGGMALCVSRSLPNQADCGLLWLNENRRVFCDRLVDAKDRDLAESFLSPLLSKYFHLSSEELNAGEKWIFCDFAGRDDKVYVRSNVHDVQRRLEELQEEFNSETGSGPRLNLVLFSDAAEHVTRIVRVLKQSQGHAFLLGVGGSGKQSLSRLATFIAGQKLFTVEAGKNYTHARWREDLKRFVLGAVLEPRALTLLLAETQITSDLMLEDVNCLLNSGMLFDLPFNSEEAMRMADSGKADCVSKGLPATKVNILRQNVARLKSNSHVVLSMSPLSELLPARLRMFPALISCCSIDWFAEWPQEALEGVAKGFLLEVEDEHDDFRDSARLIPFFKFSHKLVEAEALRFHQQLRRYNYVTPTSFLEFLRSFRRILSTKLLENKTAIKRLANGVRRLKEANEDVEKLQDDLEREKPALKIADEQVKAMVEKIEADRIEMDKKKIQVDQEEIEAKQAEADAKAIVDKIQTEVSASEKELAKTLENVSKLSANNISELVVFNKPVNKIIAVYIATCLLMLPPTKENQPRSNATDEEVDAFYVRMKASVMKDTNFLTNIKEMDYTAIDPLKIKKIREFVVDHPKRKEVWNEKEMEHGNQAAKCLFLLVNAAIKYDELFQKSKPLREQAARADKDLAEKKKELQLKKNMVESIERDLESSRKLLEEKKIEMTNLRSRIEDCNNKLERAKKLTDLLSTENERWHEEITKLAAGAKEIEGSSALAAACLTYSGPFNAIFRSGLNEKFVAAMKDSGVPFIPKFSLRTFLGSEIKIQRWNLVGLPKDENSVENGIIIECTGRCPYLVDPQKQGSNFIQKIGKDHEEGIEVIKASAPNLMKVFEQCVQFGKWLLVENCQAAVDPAFEPVLLKQVTKASGTTMIMIGEKTIPFSSRFKLMLATHLSNPQFSPETCAKVAVVNFCITPEGLEEQMLANIVYIENRQLEDQKNDIVNKNSLDRQRLVVLEDEILATLSGSKTDFLENSNLINQLSTSKKTSSEIKKRVDDSKETEQKIDAARENYRTLAKRISLLFFTISQLGLVDPMYDFSLESFEQLFKQSVESSNASVSNDLAERLQTLRENFTQYLFKNVCRSLFERHKLLAAFLFCANITVADQAIDPLELEVLNEQSVTIAPLPPNPSSFIPTNVWPRVCSSLNGLTKLPIFENIVELFNTHSELFKSIYISQSPENEPFPEDIGLPTSPIAKVLLLKSLRPDKFLAGLQIFISHYLGPKFIDFPPASLKEVFADSTHLSPIIILLSAGSDPKADFDKLADEQEMRDVPTVSLGQGQGEKAEQMIQLAAKSGSWVLLQNCHLAATWMATLEMLVTNLSANTHKDFRLWMTTLPTKTFPLTVLQKSLRISVEPANGLKANLTKTFMSVDANDFNSRSPAYKKLFYGLSFFHAIVQNRKNFGPIGWNIPYQFTTEDLIVTQRQLQMMLADSKIVPYKVLSFLTAEINYGGRVTDDKDLRLIKSLVKFYLCPEILKDTYKLSESGKYISLPSGDLADYLERIQMLPLNATPEVFFLNDNAEITTNEANAREFDDTVISIRPQNSGQAVKSREEILMEIADNLLKRCPESFDVQTIIKSFPTDYAESMNTVLTQEVIRYNRLIAAVQSNLKDLKQALRGFSVMSDELENLSKSLINKQVPETWQYPLGFLSMKALYAWVEELQHRVAFFQKWITDGKPSVFWFSGFFFPQAFMTGILQNFARKINYPIDKLVFKYKIRDDIRPNDENPSCSPDGVLLNGVYLEGAAWDSTNHYLRDPIPKELYSTLPILEIWPVISENDQRSENQNVYYCPLYKVVSRAGTLNTTGHSTNFVSFIELTIKENSEDPWIRRGVAAFLSLQY